MHVTTPKNVWVRTCMSFLCFGKTPELYVRIPFVIFLYVGSWYVCSCTSWCILRLGLGRVP